MTAPRLLTFPPTHRMKTPAAFDRAYARKRSASDNFIVLYACENGLPHPRLGCSVSKKVGNAVVRNRHKRLFREAIPRRGPEPTIEQVKASLLKQARYAARKLDVPTEPKGPPA